MNHIELFFPALTETESDVLVACLSEIGFESFWNDNGGLRAYILANDFDNSTLDQIIESYGLKVTYTFGNTNPGDWQRGEIDTFDPVTIAGAVHVRKSTDRQKPEIRYEIIVDPNLAFGSGGHPSTLLCLEMMLEIDFKGKQVADAGTGTGILAVFAEKLGAKEVIAFDNNNWALRVASKTINDNQCRSIVLSEGNLYDHSSTMKTCHIILANINMSVFRADYQLMASVVSKGSLLLISGVLASDEQEICGLLLSQQLTLVKKNYLDDWVVLLFGNETK